MADDTQTNEIELDAWEAASADAVAADDTAAEAIPAVEEAVDQKVEDAVRHVAEEAAADEATSTMFDAAASDQMAEGVTAQAGGSDAESAPKKKRERRSKQARAEKTGIAAFADAPAASNASKAAVLGTPAWIAIAVACLALGLALGRFVLGGGSAATADLSSKTTVAESELDKAFATFTYNGSTEAITVREVIELNGTLDSAVTDDGTYKLPSAEYAINVARTKILNKEIDARGIEVSDDEVAAYAEENLGTSDYDAIDSTYGMDAEKVKQLIAENCRLMAMRKEIVGEDTATMPTAPDTAEEGKEDERTKEYADYILQLVGDEWDAEKGAWVDEESSYAVALDGTDFSADSASYNMAQSVYYVAYQKYNEQQTEMSNKWTDFLNELLSKASIEVNTLVS